MITKDEIQELLHSTETYRVERTTSTDERSKSRGQARLDYALQGGRRREPAGDMDKFQEAICAFANDLPNSRKKGYLILRAHDNGGNVGGKNGGDNVPCLPPVCPQFCHKFYHKLSQVCHKSVTSWKENVLKFNMTPES